MKNNSNFRYIIQGWKKCGKNYFPVWYTEFAKTAADLAVLIECILEDGSINTAFCLDRANNEKSDIK